MNEKKDPETEKEWQPQPADTRDGGSPFLRGCGITLGIVALIFFFIVGTCFIG